MYSNLIEKIKIGLGVVKEKVSSFVENFIPILLFIIVVCFFMNTSNNNSSNQSEEDLTTSDDDYVQYNWDEIKEYMSGTESIEACTNSGCYTLDADISNGTVEQIYFPNEGYLYFSADIDENGDANDTDDRGRDWEFSIDMNSGVVENAVQEWKDNQEQDDYNY